MIEATITKALNALGYTDGWAANETDGIVLWEGDEPQPTEAELIAAGWIKPIDDPEPTPEEETPEE
jgi:hypothetical protein